MERRQIVGAACTTAIALGGGAIWGGIVNDIAWSFVLGWAGVASGVFGLAYLFVTAPKKAKAEPQIASAVPEGPKVVQNHSGSGSNYNIEKVTLGKQPFVLTDEVLAFVVQSLQGQTDVSVQSYGSVRSMQDAESISAHLERNGFKVHRWGHIGQTAMPQEMPVRIQGNHVDVDSSK